MKSLFFLCLACVSSAVFAAPVYKCKNDKGEVVFTDKKCDFDAQKQRVWDNHLGDTQYPVMMSGATPEELAGSGERTTFSEQRIESKRDEHGGYVCSTPSRTWVQNSPCPLVSSEPHTTVITHRDGTRTRVDSRYSAAVNSQELTHDQLCAELKRNSRDNESTYYRNKMKRESCP